MSNETILEAATDDNTIKFLIKNEVVMEITQEGFFWKGKLVENDKEIYQRVKDFFTATVDIEMNEDGKSE
jgi:hypothetical protein